MAWRSFPGTVRQTGGKPLVLTASPNCIHQAATMDDPVQTPNASARQFFILGLTKDGRRFRPSDWAERLCGVMSQFRPAGSGGANAHLKYSPYVRPTVLDGNKAVVVHEDLRKIEPLAYHFVLDFAKDNDLQVVDACLLPDTDGEKRSA
jgi:hypothetical protein